jgi:uncharacterized protein (DUF849 family)
VAPAPLILAVAPNGARKTKADHPALPMTPGEIAREAARSVEAGAAMIHLHVRDASGGHSLDPETYRDAIAAVRRETGDRLIVQVTSEAVGRYSAAEQMAMVRALKPEAVSLALKEILPEGAEEAPVAGFLAWVAREEILPQFILYDAAELARFGELVARGIIPDGRWARAGRLRKQPVPAGRALGPRQCRPGGRRRRGGADDRQAARRRGGGPSGLNGATMTRQSFP